jgi:outer membrane immunogenic protein
MQKTLVAAALAAILGVGGSAYAGDLASGGLRGAPTLGPVAIWTGGYLGGNLGGAWGDNNTTDLNGYWHGTFGSAALKTSQQIGGVFGGGQAGYNVQAGNIVYGLEIDFGYMGLSGSKVLTTNTPPETAEAKQGGAFFGDVTGRLGFTYGLGLFYAKGGFAFFDGTAKVSDVLATASSQSDSFTGWTLGGGLEYLVSPGWSVKAEYQYFDFGTQHSTLDNGVSIFRFDHELSAQTVKAGLNLHMYSSYQPLK